MVSWPSKTSKNNTVLLGDHKRPLMEDRPTTPRTGLLAPPWRLLMQIGGDVQTTVGLEIRDRIIVGRADPLVGFQPELDLAPYNGKENGVSRRHLAITQGEKSLYVQDLNTVNGTRINGFQLEPDQIYRLRDGDELELGRLRILVRFVRSPF